METLQSNGIYHVSLAINDLITQGKIPEQDLENQWSFFTYKGRVVMMSNGVGERYLVMGMEGKDDEDMKTLVDAFSKVFEYEPFCKYTLNFLNPKTSGRTSEITYEWDITAPKKRYKELSTEKPSDFTRDGLVKLL